jgi:hypothetical protein
MLSYVTRMMFGTWASLNHSTLSFSFYADRCDDSTDLSHPKSGTLGVCCAAWGKFTLELSLDVSLGIVFILPVCCGLLGQLKSWDSCLILRGNTEK